VLRLDAFLTAFAVAGASFFVLVEAHALWAGERPGYFALGADEEKIAVSLHLE